MADILINKEVSETVEIDLESDGGPDHFEYSHGISSIEADNRLKLFGKNELPEKKISKWYIFMEQLWQPMPIMIWIAVIIEAAIGNYIDMGILFMIQFANASIGYYEITKAGDAVAALKQSLKPSATVKRDGKFIVIDASLVVPGDLVLLGSGSAVPADCRVNAGEIDVDEAALTGESLPVPMIQGSKVKMGSTVVRGEVEATVEFTGSNTFFGKTAALLSVSL
jgi:H+-transporting ATPase